MKTLRCLWSLGLASLAAAPAWALMVDVPLDQLVASSSSVVRGQVLSLDSHWTPDHSNIVTDVAFRVDQDWIGKIAPGTTVRFQVLGGEVGGIGQRTEHQPVFTKDEQAVLFLSETPSARLVISYDEQGTYTVRGDKAVGAKGQVLPLTTFRASVRSLKSTRHR